MPPPIIAQLPAPPLRTNPTNFAERADAFLGALPNFRTQMNALATWLDTTSGAAVTAAENARDLALNYRNTANTHSTNASTARTQAQAARDLAQGYRDEALGHRNAAAGSATAAAGSATTAAQRLNDFNTRWYGSRSTPPTGTIAEGALYFNTAVGALHIRRGGNWVSAISASFDEFFNLLLARDGADSGLNADLLDGQHASYFQRDLTDIRMIELGQNFPQDQAVYIDMHSAAQTSDYRARIIRDAGANGTFAIHQTGNGHLNLFTPNGQLSLRADGALFLNGSRVYSTAEAIELNVAGTFVLASNTTSGTIAYGQNIAGSNLRNVGITSSGGVSIGGQALPGTWQCRGLGPTNGASIYVRTA